MADLTYTTRPAPARFSLANILDKFFNMLVAVGESSGIARSLQRISEMTDEEIAARGTTREALVRKVLSSHGMI